MGIYESQKKILACPNYFYIIITGKFNCIFSRISHRSFYLCIVLKMTTTSYDEKYLNMLKEIVLSIVDVDRVMVFLFGSRLKENHASRSDVDIGLFAEEKISVKLFHQIRNTIDASIIPWEVDIVDFTRADEAFKQEAMKDIKIWNKPKAMKKNLLY